MKKSFRHILTILGATWLATGITANAQTLTQDWKYTTDLPASANARWGVGKNGKIWTNDPATSTLMYWDAEGKHAQAAGVGGGGWALTVDDAGNVLVSNGKWGTASTDMKILPAGGDAVQPITLTMPRGVNAASIQYIARAKGDFMSEEGGVVYMMPSNAAGAAKIVIKNGAQVVGESSYISTSDAVVSDGQTLSVPLDMDDLTNDELAFRVRAKQDFYVSNGEEYAPLTRLNVTTTAGGDAFYWGGKLYTIEPVGTAYRDGFEVVDRSDPENPKVIASHVEEATQDPATKPSANCLTAEIVDEYTLNIYQYVPDLIVAKYTLTLPKPAPKLEARNAYAYDITVTENGENYDVAYRLNAPADAVKVQLYADGQVVKEYDGTTIAEYVDDSKAEVNNLNTVTIPAADLPKNTKVSFRVAVTSATVETATEAAKAYRFYHPAGVAIDNNTDSPYFGRLYVTEAMNCNTTETYQSANEADRQGIYVFDQMLNPVKNATGTYAFKGGQTFSELFPNGKSSYDPRKVRISKDGRVFVSGQNANGIALWELNPADLNADFTPVIEGTANADTYVIEDADGNFVAGPNMSLDVKGEGENLQLVMHSTSNAGTQFSYAGYRTDEYNLGTATEWTTAPSRNIEALSGKYTVTHSNSTVIYDNEGGFWYANSRATAKDTEPTLVHVNAEGVEDYKVADGGSAFYGGGGIAFNSDFTRLAVATDGSTVTVFAVTKDAEGKPVLTEECKFATTIGRNTNDIAWDLADNLYIVGNSGEWLKSFSLPRESGECVVAAPSQYDVTIETPALEARNAYAYDIKVEEGEGEYVVSYRLNAPAEAVEVQVANVANDEVLLTYAGTTRANYTDDSKTDVDNLNTVTIPAADLPEGIEMSFRVAVTSATVETATQFAKEYSFWSPYGIAVDNNTDSPNFGRVLVTESQSSLPASGYHTSVDDGGIGIGIYAFDPMMNPIKNSQGTYGFNGGMTLDNGTYADFGGSGAVYDLKRLQYSDDGRLFVSRGTMKYSSVWELDPNNLEAGATPVFEGTNNATTGAVEDGSGNFVAGPSTAMTVTGGGEDLKIAVVSVLGAFNNTLSSAPTRVDVYNLGTAKTWDSAPSQALESVSGKYWINTSVVNASFDADGKGLFIGQHRAAPKESEPAQVYVDLETGEVTYTDLTTTYVNAMAWNRDKSLFAMSCGAGGTVGIYEVTVTDGVPTLTQKYTFVAGTGTNTNALAFDAADNIYVASNSGELLRSFALPRESGECVVAAPSQYNVLIGELIPVYPETMYVMGDVAADADLEMTAEGEGVYTIEDVEISDAGEGYGFIKFAESTDSEETYGPAVDGTELVAGTAGDIAVNGNSYKVAVAVYDIEIDLAAGTITLTWKGDAVESMEVSTAKVIGGTGEIRVVGDAKSVSIYNMAGQAIVLNSGEMTFNVASGYYIVVVDGKTTKVMVR